MPRRDCMSLDIYDCRKNRYHIFDVEFIQIFSSGEGPLFITNCVRNGYHGITDTHNYIQLNCIYMTQSILNG
jgi:hypothetical protein